MRVCELVNKIAAAQFRKFITDVRQNSPSTLQTSSTSKQKDKDMGRRCFRRIALPLIFNEESENTRLDFNMYISQALSTDYDMRRIL